MTQLEEMTTVLAQIESCLNSRPLGTLPHNNEDGIEMLTPGHFLIGRPLQAIPDDPQSFQKQGLLRRWYLCQSLIIHFWGWRNEYLVALMRCTKWRLLHENLKIGDVVGQSSCMLMASHLYHWHKYWIGRTSTSTHSKKDHLQTTYYQSCTLVTL